MLQVTLKYGTIPYDGFYARTDFHPRAGFVAAVKHLTRSSYYGARGYIHFVSLPSGGRHQGDYLRVWWKPLIIGPSVPYTLIYFNPSTAGLSPNELISELDRVVPEAQLATMVELDTKVDLIGQYREVNSRLYRPYVRHTDNQFETTSYTGKPGSNEVRVYDKELERGGTPGQIVRIEASQVFKTQGEKRRPNLLQFLSGDLIPGNLIRRVRLVDPAALSNYPELLEAATEVGLTAALHDVYPKRKYWQTHPRLRRIMNKNSSAEIFELFLQQAEPWHAQFRSIGSLGRHPA